MPAWPGYCNAPGAFTPEEVVAAKKAEHITMTPQALHQNIRRRIDLYQTRQRLIRENIAIWIRTYSRPSLFPDSKPFKPFKPDFRVNTEAIRALWASKMPTQCVNQGVNRINILASIPSYLLDDLKPRIAGNLHLAKHSILDKSHSVVIYVRDAVVDRFAIVKNAMMEGVQTAHEHRILLPFVDPFQYQTIFASTRQEVSDLRDRVEHPELFPLEGPACKEMDIVASLFDGVDQAEVRHRGLHGTAKRLDRLGSDLEASWDVLSRALGWADEYNSNHDLSVLEKHHLHQLIYQHRQLHQKASPTELSQQVINYADAAHSTLMETRNQAERMRQLLIREGHWLSPSFRSRYLKMGGRVERFYTRVAVPHLIHQFATAEGVCRPASWIRFLPSSWFLWRPNQHFFLAPVVKLAADLGASGGRGIGRLASKSEARLLDEEELFFEHKYAQCAGRGVAKGLRKVVDVVSVEVGLLPQLWRDCRRIQCSALDADLRHSLSCELNSRHSIDAFSAMGKTLESLAYA